MTVSLLPITIVPVKMFQENQFRIQLSHSLVHYWNIDLQLPHLLRWHACHSGNHRRSKHYKR